VEMRDVGRGQYSGFARLPELIKRLNAMSQGVTYSAPDNMLQYKLRQGGKLSDFDRQMIAFTDPKTQLIPLRLTNRQGLDRDPHSVSYYGVEGDIWQSGYVDIDDLLESTDLGLQFVLVHFLRERTATPNYAQRMGSPSLDPHFPGPLKEFRNVHALGIASEVDLLRDYFGDPTIHFLTEPKTGQIIRVYRNSRGDLIQARERSGSGAKRGIDAISIEVVTKSGKVYTAEKYRDMLTSELHSFVNHVKNSP
jgi:hypothetical protein